MRLLQCANIDVNQSMPSGDTVLHLAIRIDMNEICKAIIPKFMDFVKAKNKKTGFNPLHEAANKGNSYIV